MAKFFTGFITGILVFVLAIGIGAYVLLTQVSVGDLIGNNDTPISDSTLLDMGKLVIGTIGNLETTSLNDLETNFGLNIKGKLQEKVGAENMSRYDEVFSCGFGGITTAIKQLTMSDVLLVAGVSFGETLDEVLKPVTDAKLDNLFNGSGVDKQFGDVINGITIAQVSKLGVTLPDIPLFTAEANQNKPLMDIVAEVGTNVKLGEILTINTESPKILQTLADCTLSGENSIDKKIGTLKLSEIIDISATSPKILRELADCTLAGDSLSTKINSLTLGSVIDITENSAPILKALQNTEFNNLGTAINDLKLNQIMEIKENTILKQLENSTLSTINTDIQNLLQDATIDNLILWGVINVNNLDVDKIINGKRFGSMTLNDIVTIINGLPSTASEQVAA